MRILVLCSVTDIIPLGEVNACVVNKSNKKIKIKVFTINIQNILIPEYLKSMLCG